MKALVLLLLLPAIAHAQTRAEATADYAVYVLGLRMAEARIHLAYTPSDYRIDMSGRTTGAAAVFVRGVQTSAADGSWQDQSARPHVLTSSGTWNGDPHRLVISFTTGGPHVTTLIPPDRTPREKPPPALLARSVDIPSAIVAMIHQLAITGRCARQVLTFDGRRLSEVEASDAGAAVLPPGERSSFSGEAQRCDFAGREVGGFDTLDDWPDARKIRHARAWFARLTPDGPPMPVRIDFEAKLVGEAQMVLVAADQAKK